MEEFVAHDAVRHEDKQAVTLDARGVRVRGIRWANEFNPAVPNVLLRRAAADLIFLQQVFDQIGERSRGTLAGARRIFGRPTTEVADQLLGDLAELVRLVGRSHDGPRITRMYANQVGARGSRQLA